MYTRRVYRAAIKPGRRGNRSSHDPILAIGPVLCHTSAAMSEPSTHDAPGCPVSGVAQFTTTHWSVVLEAARPGSPGATEAFARLYRDYWYPLYAYVRRRGRSPHEAEDLTQDFFVALLERQRLSGLERGGGRFRSFLLKSLQNFLANEWDRASALKRGGGQAIASLEEVDAESRFLADSTTESPEEGFDRHWAFAVIEHAMQHLETELRTAGKEQMIRALRPHLQGDRNGRPYADIAAEWSVSESAVKMTVHRLRQRYGELLRAEVARTVGDDDQVESELRHLLEVVSD
jgi:RNA polymerase sigma factor (sigma-70 family)